MNIDGDKLLEQALRDGIRDGVAKQIVSGYGDSPLTKLIKAALDNHYSSLEAMLSDAVSGCVDDPAFRAEIVGAVRSNLAKTLVQRFGGEIEKQVNALKSNPTTRARITIAIEEIVKNTKT